MIYNKINVYILLIMLIIHNSYYISSSIIDEISLNQDIDIGNYLSIYLSL
jgi:hypothetical protein